MDTKQQVETRDHTQKPTDDGSERQAQVARPVGVVQQSFLTSHESSRHCSEMPRRGRRDAELSVKKRRADTDCMQLQRLQSDTICKQRPSAFIAAYTNF